ncbi:hypothetical protein OEA41_002670 [Lepraria neglecta]|uniref:Developmental regulatory protein wetA n=1 Tax=Lepraria neglecta TaxID=209136 RepID=A0AAE0DIC4_9LECA|nr:hypothetical protein OEA41_002670 [Lepraria neglecta]
MRPDTMLTFDTYLPEDKDLGFITPDESDPYSSFFEQFPNDDPTPISDTTEESDGFQAFDFSFDDETESSESCSADSKLALPNSPPAGLHYLPIQRTLALRPHRALIQSQAPRAAISNSELLSLEGKSPPEAQYTKDHTSSTQSSAAHTLRRKSKFYTPAAEPPRGRSPHKQKSSNEMSRPTYGHVRHESLPYPEWAQRLEQISLQQPISYLQTSPPRSNGTFRDKRPSNILTSTQTPCQDRLPQAKCPNEKASPGHGISQGSTPGDNSRLITVAISPTLQNWTNQGEDDVSPLTLSDNDRLHAPPLRHAHTWNFSPVTPLDGTISPVSPGFTVSPQHVQPSWLHGLPENTTSYYQNNTAPTQLSATSTQYTAPPLSAHAIPDFTPQSFMAGYSPYGDFIPEDPSSGYAVTSADQLQSTIGADSLPPGFFDTKSGDLANLPRPCTPPSHPHSPSPLSSPLKRHQRSQSKTHRRNQKSLGHIKSPKSATSLKSPKSAGTLRSPKSTAQLGFVNLGPNDKSKILTGVAPSGSSKTKARREQEANEKKRRSSQAALKAVEALGGDVERLKADLEIEGMELGI